MVVRGKENIVVLWPFPLTQWTWVWASSGSWWWTGKPGMLQSMGSERVGHPEQLNWTECILNNVHISDSREMYWWFFSFLIAIKTSERMRTSFFQGKLKTEFHRLNFPYLGLLFHLPRERNFPLLRKWGSLRSLWQDHPGQQRKRQGIQRECLQWPLRRSKSHSAKIKCQNKLLAGKIRIYAT